MSDFITDASAPESLWTHPNAGPHVSQPGQEPCHCSRSNIPSRRTAVLPSTQDDEPWDGTGGVSCEQLLRCGTAQQAETLVRHLAASYGFEHFLYDVRMQLEGGAVFEHAITNYPHPWRQMYHDGQYARIALTVHHCTRRVTPLTWNADNYTTREQKDMREVHHVDVHLAPRETECLRWVAQGKTNWEMARILVVSEHAIAYHLRNVMNKLQVSSRHQAVKLALSLGLLEI